MEHGVGMRGERRRRVLLDANLWSYVGRQGVATELAALEDHLGVELLLQPAALIECLSTADRQVRQNIVDAMTRRRRPTLRTEAAEEADEFIGEVQRLRPKWLRQVPNRTRTSRLDKFWTRDVWREARRDADRFRQTRSRILAHDERVTEYLHSQQRYHQAKAREEGVKLDPADLLVRLDDDVPVGQYPGLSRDDTFEVWRMNFQSVYWFSLTVLPRRALLDPSLDTTYADWISAEVKLASLAEDPADFNRFCFYEVETENVPRNWIRNVIEWSQMNWRVERSSAWDSAHSAYVFDCDDYLTADKRFVWALEAVRDISPRTFAEPRLVEYVEPITDAIEAALTR